MLHTWIHHFENLLLVYTVLFDLLLTLALHFEKVVNSEVELDFNGFIRGVVDFDILGSLGADLDHIEVEDIVFRRADDLGLGEVGLDREFDILEDIGFNGEVGGDFGPAQTTKLLPALLLLPPQLQVVRVQRLLHHVVLVVVVTALHIHHTTS